LVAYDSGPGEKRGGYLGSREVEVSCNMNLSLLDNGKEPHHRKRCDVSTGCIVSVAEGGVQSDGPAREGKKKFAREELKSSEHE